MNEARQSAVSGEKSYSIRTLSVGMRLFETVLSADKDWGITELAVAVGLSKHQIFRHLHTLCDNGFLQQDEQTGRFSIGLRSYQMLQSISSKEWLMQAARREMVRLRDQSGKTVTLTKPIPGPKILVLHVEPGPNPLQYALHTGAILDTHASAHGKVALAFSDQIILDQVFDLIPTKYTNLTVTDQVQLRDEIEMVRKRGWAVAPGETALGMNALAVPIITNGVFRGSIGYFGPLEVVPPAPDLKDVEALQDASKRIAVWG